MVALKTAEIPRYLAAPDAARPIALVYGPDSGLVHERARQIALAVAKDLDDPFTVVRLDGDALAADPVRLADEAHTMAMFGGRRLIWVRAGSRGIDKAVAPLFEETPRDAVVVIEAGDLKRGKGLRSLVERAANAVAIPCYADEGRDLARLIDEELAKEKLTIAPDARAALLELLGGDRLLSRSELAKLVLYARGQSRIEIDDVHAAVGDASALAIDAIIDAAFSGNTAELDTLLGKARAEDIAAAAILALALRHGYALHRARLGMGAGRDARSAAESFEPRLNFRRVPIVAEQLSRWRPDELAAANAGLADAILNDRRQPGLSRPLLHRALLEVARRSRAR